MRKYGTCIHFTGLARPPCQAGVDFRQFTARLSTLAYPCFSLGPDDTRPQADCPQKVLPTAEEGAAEEAQGKAELTAYFQARKEREARGACGQCGTRMTAKVQVGRCIYVEPCGCRLGQGWRTQDGTRVNRVEYPTKEGA